MGSTNGKYEHEISFSFYWKWSICRMVGHQYKNDFGAW